MSTLAIRLLGPPEIERDGSTAAPPRGHKSWAVLAYLALAERPVARTRLAGLIFGDADDPRGALRWTLAQLRRALGEPEALDGDPLDLRLPAGAAVDVLALATGAPDPALVRGELLEGVDPGAGPDFDAWLLVERRRFAGICEAVLRDAALARLAAGAPLEAAALASRVIELSKQLQLQLKQIQQEVGITFVHVTHDQEEAMSMADTIAVMNEGRIEQAGGAADLYERPRTEFVANFLGLSNLVDAQLRGAGGNGYGHSTVETHDGATLHVPSDRIGPHGTDAVRIGVRPEKVTLSPAGNDVTGGANVLRGTVVVASFLGVSIQYVVRAAGGEELTVFAQNLDGAEPESLGPGREVQLSWDPQHTFVVAKEGS